MRPPRRLPFRSLAGWAALTVAGMLVADSPTPDPAAKQERKDDLTVTFSPFVVSSTPADPGRYAALASISAGRVRLDLMDSSQSISVITGEILADVAALRVADAAHYAAGVSESTLPTSWERINLRGFQAEGRTVDGITYGIYPSDGFQNIDPVIIERMEIVKGPNSILAPQPTSPGGTINLATKQPQFRNFGSIELQAGPFDANGAVLDVNRTWTDRLAVRFVGAGRDYDHAWDDAYVHSLTLMPEFTYRFPHRAEVTLQYTFTDWKAQNYLGLPIDPTSGTATSSRILGGISRELNVYPANAYRSTRQHEFKLFGTAELWRGIQMRLVAAYNTAAHDGPQINTGASIGGYGGNVDPLTGYWNSGMQYAQVPPYTGSPLVVQPTRVFARSGVELVSDPRQFNLQNDYAYILENDTLKATTLAGFAYNDTRTDNAKTYLLVLANPIFNIDHYADTTWTRGAASAANSNHSRFTQFYLSEILALWQNRVILNAAGSWQGYDQSVHNLLKDTTARTSPETTLPSWGVVLKPLGETLSLYYSHTEQSSANAPSATGAFVPPLSTSRQDEFGARARTRDNRFYLTVAHYAIVQDNFATPNPGNLATPPPNPPLPNLFSDRTAEGWEYELRFNPDTHFSVIAGYTHFKNRDPNGVEFRGVAERAGSLLASYAFDRRNLPALDGFRFTLGVDYLADRPGDTPATAFTVASTPANTIPNQATFYLGARTLLNLTLAYDSKHHWGAQVNVDNLLDEEYLMASNTRSAVFPGTPRNFRLTLRYRF